MTTTIDLQLIASIITSTILLLASLSTAILVIVQNTKKISARPFDLIINKINSLVLIKTKERG